MYDLVVANALLVDGTGSKPVTGGIAAKDGRIVAMGPGVTHADPAQKTIDAGGLAVAPGFIDLHSHSDAEFLANERLEAKLLQGITLEVTGQCGLSLVPTAPETLDTHLSYFHTQFTASQLDALDWKTMRGIADYARRAAALPHTINAAPLIGHVALRNAVMGFRGSAPSAAEQERMEAILDENLAAGAWGMSLGLVYPPGSFAALPELVGLAKVIARHDALIHVHMRNEGAYLFEAVQEMLSLAEQSGAHIHISHLKLMGTSQWGRAPELLSVIDAARRKGAHITADQYPYIGSSTGLSVLVPNWAMEGGIPALMWRLASPERGKVLAGMAQEIERRGGPGAVMSTSNGRYPEYDFCRIDELAAREGVSPAEMVARLLEKTDAEAKAVYFSMDQGDVLRIMEADFVAVGTDGYAFNFDQAKGAQHPRSFGTFPRFLRTALDENLMPLEKAVWKMTGLAASFMGFADRGTLAPGKVADLVIFAPDRIRDTATFENPFQKPEGIAAIIVEGRVTAEDNALTNARAGSLRLRKF